MLHRPLTPVLILLTLAGCAGGHTTTTPAPKSVAGTRDSTGTAARASAAKTDPKPYKDVITAKATTDSGVFTVHQVGDKWYYEIPASMFGREFLIVSRVARAQDGVGYGGSENGSNVVRFVRDGNKVYLRQVSFATVADSNTPIALAVRNSTFEPIVFGFDVQAYGADSSAVIEVGPLYTTDVPMLGLPSFRRTAYQVRRLDNSRTFMNSIHAYPRNIESRVTLTYDAGKPPSGASSGAISVEMNHSMLLLPEKPMMPRLLDERVGYFGIQQADYGRDVQRTDVRRYIARWRLEPKDTAAFLRGELVEPIKPIVYYIDPATPVKWRKYLIEGVNDWQAAFEAAGFKNAIYAREAPTPQEDPEFSTEDARYSVIRYLASDVENASGPHVSDPRTGEILETHIQWYHNVMNLLRNWYLVQTAAVNPAARQVEFSDEVMGELIRFVSSHEVGHTLGLPHNMKASSAYPVDSLRSPSFTKAFNTAPSIMDYARFNYVAQPGDGDVSLHPGIGPYDKYAISWGYRPILAARTPDAEKVTLNAWIAEHAGDPMYRFGDPSGTDPGSQTEDLGDDGVKASEYGIMNLKRILPKLLEYSYEPGADFSQLAEMYGQVAAQWNRYMGHVVTIIGGIDWTRKNVDQTGPAYTAIPRQRQKEAMRFLNEQALQTPTWMFDPAILERIGIQGSSDRIKGYMTGVLGRMLQPSRLARVAELQNVADGGYPLPEYLGDIRDAVWTELARGTAPDFYRRSLQRAWIETMGTLVNPPEATPTPATIALSDIRPTVRAELVQLRARLRSAAGRGDAVTRAHYADAAEQVDQILNPR
ncbi:MAG TPA: zinc-dependent metalloprotease [Gemmatimonadales bacterium]|nr:zinc-dependent metalloprotease [Gemmatimonadales bacterium]